MLLFRVVSPSNTGGVPLDDVHTCFGPGIAASYQPGQSTVGGVMF